jgi:hypothetical protein
MRHTHRGVRSIRRRYEEYTSWCQECQEICLERSGDDMKDTHRGVRSVRSIRRCVWNIQEYQEYY